MMCFSESTLVGKTFKVISLKNKGIFIKSFIFSIIIKLDDIVKLHIFRLTILTISFRLLVFVLMFIFLTLKFVYKCSITKSWKSIR